MNFAMAFNKKYVDYAIVAMTALCECNPEHNDIYILHSELNQNDIIAIRDSLSKYDVELLPQIIDLGNDRISKLPTMEYWSKEIYFRLFLPEILPEYVDRILYIDTDVIVHKSITELYESDFEGKDIIAVPDSNGTTGKEQLSDKQKRMLGEFIDNGHIYFNSGVILLNMARMRGRSFEQYFDAMKLWNFEVSASDQDILNFIHHNNVKYVSWEKYDLFARHAYDSGWTYKDALEKNYITHFAGNKPWECKSIHYEIEKLWWDYAIKTPIAQKLMEDFLHSALFECDLEEKAIGIAKENEQIVKAIEEANKILIKFS